jgi:aminoglycoside phosphotransferase (APT) family kinase protein
MPVPREVNERTATAPAPFPDLEALAEGLAALLDGREGGSGLVQILDREPNPYTSTCPAEIVTCRLADDSQRRLLCKYAAGEGHNDHGSRGGVTYEAEVYRHVLQTLPLPAPAFYGAFPGRESVETWLVLEYLEAGIRVSKLPTAGAMPSAAAWCGRFHALSGERFRSEPLSFLTRYDADYYAGWSRRTLRCGEPVLSQHPWLRTVCRRYEDMIPVLTGQPQTVIHGEYTPHNVLWQAGRIFPTDWESAALAVGEIDLATLVEGWGEDTVRACEQSYREARWPGGAPSAFAETLAAARLYVTFRWLAARGDWTEDARSLSLLRELYRLAEQLGLLL